MRFCIVEIILCTVSVSSMKLGDHEQDETIHQIIQENDSDEFVPDEPFHQILQENDSDEFVPMSSAIIENIKDLADELQMYNMAKTEKFQGQVRFCYMWLWEKWHDCKAKCGRLLFSLARTYCRHSDYKSYMSACWNNRKDMMCYVDKFNLLINASELVANHSAGLIMSN